MLEIYASFVSVAANALRSGIGADKVAAYLDEAAAYIQAGAEFADRLERTRAEIQAMVDEGREPTEDELSAVKQRILDASSRIQGSG